MERFVKIISDIYGEGIGEIIFKIGLKMQEANRDHLEAFFKGGSTTKQLRTSPKKALDQSLSRVKKEDVLKNDRIKVSDRRSTS